MAKPEYESQISSANEDQRRLALIAARHICHLCKSEGQSPSEAIQANGERAFGDETWPEAQRSIARQLLKRLGIKLPHPQYGNIDPEE